MPRFNAFPRDANIINLKIFPTHGGIFKLEKNSRRIMETDKALRSLRKYEGIYL